MRTGGSLAIVQETENDDLEQDVNLRTLEGDDLKWVDWEEEDDDEGGGETEVLKVATVPEAAITESLSQSMSFKVRVFIDSLGRKNR